MYIYIYIHTYICIRQLLPRVRPGLLRGHRGPREGARHDPGACTHIHVYVYVYVHVYVHVYVYMYACMHVCNVCM